MSRIRSPSCWQNRANRRRQEVLNAQRKAEREAAEAEKEAKRLAAAEEKAARLRAEQAAKAKARRDEKKRLQIAAAQQASLNPPTLARPALP